MVNAISKGIYSDEILYVDGESTYYVIILAWKVKRKLRSLEI